MSIEKKSEHICSTEASFVDLEPLRQELSCND
jgi:hypothetical protein